MVSVNNVTNQSYLRQPAVMGGTASAVQASQGPMVGQRPGTGLNMGDGGWTEANTSKSGTLVGNFIKGASTGFISSMVKGLFCDDQTGKFSIGKTLWSAVKIAATVAVCAIPVVGPVIGVGLALWGVANTVPGMLTNGLGAMEAYINGDSEKAKELAFNAGRDTTGAALSVVGARAAVKELGVHVNAAARATQNGKSVFNISEELPAAREAMKDIKLRTKEGRQQFKQNLVDDIKDTRANIKGNTSTVGKTAAEKAQVAQERLASQMQKEQAELDRLNARSGTSSQRIKDQEAIIAKLKEQQEKAIKAGQDAQDALSKKQALETELTQAETVAQKQAAQAGEITTIDNNITALQERVATADQQTRAALARNNAAKRDLDATNPKATQKIAKATKAKQAAYDEYVRLKQAGATLRAELETLQAEKAAKAAANASSAGRTVETIKAEIEAQNALLKSAEKEMNQHTGSIRDFISPELKAQFKRDTLMNNVKNIGPNTAINLATTLPVLAAVDGAAQGQQGHQQVAQHANTPMQPFNWNLRRFDLDSIAAGEGVKEALYQNYMSQRGGGLQQHA